MRAIKIDVKKKEVYEVEIDDSLDSWYAQLECSCFTQVGTQFPNRDMLLVDDDGLLHEPLGAFRIGQYPQALSGHGLIVGTGEEGESISAKTPLMLIRHIVTFVDPDTLPEPSITFIPGGYPEG